MKAYVLVQTEPDSDSVADLLKTIPGVALAEDVRGAYDAVAVADFDFATRSMESIVSRILELPEVSRVITARINGPDEMVQDDEAA